jgi:hypothetical protein
MHPVELFGADWLEWGLGSTAPTNPSDSPPDKTD